MPKQCRETKKGLKRKEMKECIYVSISQSRILFSYPENSTAVSCVFQLPTAKLPCSVDGIELVSVLELNKTVLCADTETETEKEETAETV